MSTDDFIDADIQGRDRQLRPRAGGGVMEEYKYVLPRFSIQARIDKLKCIKETPKFVTLIDRYECEQRRSKSGNVYDTWGEAHAALTCSIEAEIEKVQLRLQYLQSVADNVRDMKPQAGEVV